MSSPSQGLQALPPSDDIPIDPALLALDLNQEDPSDQSEAEEGGSESSEADDNEAGDAYGEEEPLVDPGVPAGRVDPDDEVFRRMAGQIAKGGEKVAQKELLREVPQDLDEEVTRTRRIPAKKPPRKRLHRPDREASRLLGQANLAFSTSTPEQAIELYLEVIRHDPHIHSAWTSLAQCYDEIGRSDMSRQMRFCGAHVDSEGEAWVGLAGEFRDIDDVDSCIYCLRKAVSVDPTDANSLYELASIFKSQNAGNSNTNAIYSFKRLLRVHPPSTYNFNLITEFLPLFQTTASLQAFGSDTLLNAFNYHLARIPSPTSPGSSLQLEHIVMLADLLLRMDDLEEALAVVRRGQRWLQGRADQRSWDGFDDDREYFPPGYVRDDGEDGSMESVEGSPMDTDLRHRLALIRLRLGNDDDAIMHIDELLNLDVIQYHTLFIEIGNALMKRDLWEKALDCYGAIQECEVITDDPKLVFSIGICHHQLKNNSQAIEALRWVVSEEPDHLEARLRLASVLDDTGQKAEALEIVSEVLRIRAQRDEAPTRRGRGSNRQDPEDPQPRQTKADRAATRALNKRVLEQQMTNTMQDLWEQVQVAEREIATDPSALDRFIMAAGTMVENYRLARSNFTKGRGVIRVPKIRKAGKHDLTSQALALQDRLERAMGFDEEDVEPENAYIIVRMSEFYGLTCDQWLTLTVKYCCVLMVRNEADVAMDILEHVVWSNLFNNRKSEIAIRMTIVSCSIRLKAHDKIIDNCKRLSQMHQFRNEPYMVLLAALTASGSGQGAITAWQTLQLQKYMHRDLRIWDMVIRGRKLHYNGRFGRWAMILKNGVSDRLGEVVEDEDDVEGGGDEGDEAGDGDGDGDGEDEDEDDDGGEKRGGVGDRVVGIDDDDEDVADEDAGRVEGEEQEVPLPKLASPELNWTYGQYMLNAKAYQSALFYFFRAYEINQYDPLICLSIAQSYFGRAMNRQSDNRNFQMAQGMAFMARYRNLSPKDAVSREEVNYNFAKAFHSLGVQHLAVKHYEMVLTSIQTRMDEAAAYAAECAGSEYGDEAPTTPEMIRGSSLAHETAHNLMLIYAGSGSMILVKEKSKWLAI